MIPEHCLRCLIWGAARAICSWEAEGGGNSSPRAASVCSQLWAFCSHQLCMSLQWLCSYFHLLCSVRCAKWFLFLASPVLSDVPSHSRSIYKAGDFFHDTFIPTFSKMYFFRNFSIGRGNLASLKGSLASSVIVQHQKYPRVHVNFQNAFPSDIPSLPWDHWEPMTPPLSRQMRVRQNFRQQ